MTGETFKSLYNPNDWYKKFLSRFRDIGGKIFHQRASNYSEFPQSREFS